MTGRKPKPKPSGESLDPRDLQPPAELDPVARAEWDRLTAALSASRTVAKIDRTVLILHCVAFARWKEARAQVDKTGGEVVKSPAGFPVLNPWASVARRAFDELMKTGAALGLSPTDRARLAGKEPKRAAKPEADGPFSRLRIAK